MGRSQTVGWARSPSFCTTDLKPFSRPVTSTLFLYSIVSSSLFLFMSLGLHHGLPWETNLTIHLDCPRVVSSHGRRGRFAADAC